MDSDPVRNALSRAVDVYVCDTCGTEEAIQAFNGTPTPLTEWAIALAPQNYDMVHTYYYTFGSSTDYPHQTGWVEVKALTWEEAHKKFEAAYPCRRPGILNCAFFYEEERWAKMNPANNWPGYRCYGVIE